MKNFGQVVFEPSSKMKLHASTVILDTLVNGMHILTKEYDGFRSKTLLSYHNTQNELKQVLDGIYDVSDKKYTYLGQQVPQIQLNILDLSGVGIYGACIFDSKKKISITSPQYISGPTFADLLGEKDIYCDSYKQIVMYLRELSQKIGFPGQQIHPVNIKIVSFEDGVLHIMITDVACDIKTLINDKDWGFFEIKPLPFNDISG